MEKSSFLEEIPVCLLSFGFVAKTGVTLERLLTVADRLPIVDNMLPTAFSGDRIRKSRSFVLIDKLSIDELVDALWINSLAIENIDLWD
jgi:hypothetical protein